MRQNRKTIISALSVKGYTPLSELDFILKNQQDGSMFYVKTMQVQGYSIEYLVDFSDDSLLDFPRVYISERVLDNLKHLYKHIQEPIPHLMKENLLYKNSSLYSICYQLHNLNIVPRGNIFQVVALVEEYVEDFFRKITSEAGFLQEYEEDFGGVVISLINISKISTKWYILLNKDRNCLFEKKQESPSLNPSTEQGVILIKVDDGKKPNFSGLVRQNNVTIEAFMHFVHRWDSIAYGKFMANLKKPDSKKKFVFLWKGLTLAGYFPWNRNPHRALKHQDNKGLLDEKIQFVDTKILDFEKSVLRNLPQRNKEGLLNTRILLIGLGAIGGYMADSLTKLGAGLKSDFVLADNDILEVDNIGRHVLGFEYCGNSKAFAICVYLQKQSFFQLEKIRAEFKNVSSYDIQFFSKNNFDLVIDATGSIEVQEFLNETMHKLSKEKRPILQHLWIVGNGECVQGLWISPEKQAEYGGCIFCLGTSASGLHEEYLPVKELDSEQRIGVCSAFTPYAVSGGMMAASLGINMILEWLETGQVKNNYQTRYNSSYSQTKLNDFNLTAYQQCPFCSEEK